MIEVNNPAHTAKAGGAYGVRSVKSSPADRQIALSIMF